MREKRGVNGRAGKLLGKRVTEATTERSQLKTEKKRGGGVCPVKRRQRNLLEKKEADPSSLVRWGEESNWLP